ncbi:MAG: DUF4232 domain-containing protein [Streptosporangiaceae bacterium]
MKVSVFGTAMLASVVLAFGCGCGSGHSSAGGRPTASTDSGMTTSPASTSGSGTPAASSPVSGSTGTTASGSGQDSGAPAACATSSLRVATAPGSGGAAGSFYFDLTFTNIGSKACTLYGYPGVSFTAASHTQLGQPAERDQGQASQLVTLSPGSVASNQVRIPDVTVYSQSACRPTTAALIKVFPPNQTAAVYVATSAKVCTTSQGRSGVQPVVPGGHAGV